MVVTDVDLFAVLLADGCREIGGAAPDAGKDPASRNDVGGLNVRPVHPGDIAVVKENLAGVARDLFNSAWIEKRIVPFREHPVAPLPGAARLRALLAKKPVE